MFLKNYTEYTEYRKTIYKNPTACAEDKSSFWVILSSNYEKCFKISSYSKRFLSFTGNHKREL